ncbi:hypothetical protein BVRB_034650 [Beta vulgaris subsp. vulgaris]|uniref:Uncharacterized protein n=1 Tax=Beta vulgaris subsp. vulgaris TaxID=3555 RepID=A0A0J7YQZ1_BETVV|nr:hypothetical protein BVRB_034650 [Beta vulgaris subsp. vulgaris]
MMKIRPNIIHRRVRERPDQVLIENLDKEYQQEQERAEKRRQRRQTLLDERRKHLFATPEEKAGIIRESLESRQRLEKARQAQKQALDQEERCITSDVQQHLTVAEEIDDMEQAARRAYMRNLCQENLKVNYHITLDRSSCL